MICALLYALSKDGRTIIPRLILNNYKSRLHISWRLRDAQIGFVTQLILFLKLSLFLKSNHVPV